MEKINILLFIIIVVYLTYSYVESRKKDKEKEDFVDENIKEKKYYKFIIAAAIAASMGEKEYRIRKIFLKGKEEKISYWKIFGRHEKMMKTNIIKNK